jgi:hypothetical protein
MPRRLGVQPLSVAAVDRIAAKSIEGNGGCWEWQGTKFNTGYGAIRLGTVAMGTVNTYLTHRIAYQVMICELPKVLTLDHLCRNIVCWNPDHLDPCPTQVNTSRGTSPIIANLLKTHCPQGHPYSGENLYQRPGSTARICRACNIAGTPGRVARARERRRAARLAAQQSAA